MLGLPAHAEEDHGKDEVFVVILCSLGLYYFILIKSLVSFLLLFFPRFVVIYFLVFDIYFYF